VKVRPNGLAKGVPMETTIRNIGSSLRELGDYGQGHGVEIWMEVHGPTTENPPVSAAIMQATRHDNVGVCWNSNETDVVNGSVKASFELLKPWIRNAHINDLSNNYPWRELFALLRNAGYERYTLCEVDPASKEPERFLGYYRALWTELNRACG
jgi:sugar phosphate isomerase/epimerase